MNLPNKYLVDTNVPKTANLATYPDRDSEIPDKCILGCIEVIEHVIKNRALVIDSGDEIYNEYRSNLSMRGQPGVGDRFMKWVHDNRWTFPDTQRVEIKKEGDSYCEFPSHEGLVNFDRSDRKFIAIANAHPPSKKPPIFQATDSKWWGWKDALEEIGISVYFICQEYIERKYQEKMGT